MEDRKKLEKMELQAEKSQVEDIPVSKLREFDRHPFQVRDDKEMNALTESIQKQGILSPLIVRTIRENGDGKPEKSENEKLYEILSGHRRFYAAKKAGLETVPTLITDFDRDAAAIAVVDSNLHREHLLPSEKAFAYKLKMEALSHQGKRTDLTSDRTGPKLTAEAISDSDSATQVKRYIRLTYLIPDFLEQMDAGQIALSVGVELSFLSQKDQYSVLEQCKINDCTPSYSQAWRMHKLSREGLLTLSVIQKILNEKKANQRELLRLPMERIQKFAPGATPKQLEDFVWKACSYYSRYLAEKKKRCR